MTSKNEITMDAVAILTARCIVVNNVVRFIDDYKPVLQITAIASSTVDDLDVTFTDGSGATLSTSFQLKSSGREAVKEHKFIRAVNQGKVGVGDMIRLKNIMVETRGGEIFIYRISDFDIIEPDRPNTRSRSTPPDCTVVVGGKEFMHHSYLLRHSSDYFGALFDSGMREHGNMRVELSEKDPDEWEMVSAYFLPHGSNRHDITAENVATLMFWFHFLGMDDSLIRSCEEVFHVHVKTELSTWTDLYSALEFSNMYSLSKTKMLCWHFLHSRLSNSDAISMNDIARLKLFLGDTLALPIWKLFEHRDYLPSEWVGMNEQRRGEILKDEAFEHTIHNRMTITTKRSELQDARDL
jgi:hypothetical protein